MHGNHGGSIGSIHGVRTGNGTAAVEARRDSAVAREIEQGKKIGVSLHDLIDRIGQRVEPVRLVSPPSGPGDEPSAMPSAATDLAREIQSINGTFAEAGRRLEILLGSIDL